MKTTTVHYYFTVLVAVAALCYSTTLAAGDDGAETILLEQNPHPSANISNDTTVGFVQRLFFSTLGIFIPPMFYGTSMVLFSWLLVYFDSKVPGVYPPSPISPKKHRTLSGHTFHLGYAMGLFNGFIVFVLALWNNTPK